MRVARLHAPGQLRVNDEPEPVPEEGGELLRVGAVGICGSDLLWFAGGEIGDAKLERPLVLGHECAAVSARGERVAVDPAIPCGQCELCRKGHPNLCPQVRFAGHGSQDGFLRDWIAWPRACVYALPDSISAAEGAMLEPLGVALHAIDLGELRAGMTVGVFGCGPIGLLIVQLARLSGAVKIITTDLLPHRLEAARICGAHQAILAGAGSELDEILTATSGRGIDVAFEVAGVQAAVDAAVASVCPGGKVILVGIPADDHTSFAASAARRKGLTIKLVRRMKHTFPRAIDLVAKGLVEVGSLVTHRFSLNDISDAFLAAQRRDGLKVMVEL